jgi:hypothetical protein
MLRRLGPTTLLRSEVEVPVTGWSAYWVIGVSTPAIEPPDGRQWRGVLFLYLRHQFPEAVEIKVGDGL